MIILLVVVVCVGQMVEFSTSDVAASSRVINTHNTNTHNFLIFGIITYILPFWRLAFFFWE
jgi:hypothetical protein